MGNNQEHTFVWFELHTVGAEAGCAFYRDLFGLEVQVAGDGSYRELKSGVTFGGVTELQEEAKAMGATPHWLGYVAVADCDAAALRATELGGAVRVPPADIPNVGRFAIIADPTGASLALFTGRSSDREPARNHPGEIVWCELVSSDPDKALAFYRALFGWRETEAMDMGGGQTYRMWGREGTTMGGAMATPEGIPMSSCWMYYHHAPSTDATIARAKALGATVMHGPVEVPGGFVATMTDPQGAIFCIHGAK